MTDTDLADFRRDRAALAIRTRLATLDGPSRKAMTQAARDARDANILERLKDVVDPDRLMSDTDRERAARDLFEARRLAARLAAQRRERNRQLAEAAEAVFDAEAAS